MITIIDNPKNNRYVFLLGDTQELAVIEKHFNKIPDYMFLPQFRGVPKPVVYMHRANKKDGSLYMWAFAGLWKEIIDYCKATNISINDKISEDFKHRKMCSLDEFTSIVNGWHLNLKPRDYQIKAAWLILNFRQSLSQLATRAGKTLIFYLIARYMTEYCGVKKTLMVVPNVTLVTQGLEDMKEYADFFIGEAVWAGGEQVSTANLTIGTYQSLVNKLSPQIKDTKTKRFKPNPKYDPDYFNDFDLVCIDEAHHLVCDSIEKILSQPFIEKVKCMFGFTGTLPKPDTIESFSCHMLMGPKIQDVTTAELVEQGFICNASIQQIIIKHDFNDIDFCRDWITAAEYVLSDTKKIDGKEVMRPKEEQRLTMTKVKTLPLVLSSQKHLYTEREWVMFLKDYAKTMGSECLQIEQLTACMSKARYKVIDEIINTNNGNGILFGNHSEYIEEVAAYLKEHYPDKEVYIIKGSTSPKKRNEIKSRMLETNNCLVVASYGVLSTGVTLKNVNWGILCESYKSDIINKQTIGRGLLTAEGKEYFYIYDLIDDMPTGKIIKHGNVKMKTFINSKFVTSRRVFYLKN